MSVWLDEISRRLVAGGELARFVGLQSLRGVTSSPLLFKNAILGSADYQDEIETMAVGGADARTICDALAMRA